ncbi:2'-5' RNA ligase family protein [Yimella sp. cx-573]|nr:2'-5' RNA ligase family protein [Yimella sp. cx-573]
MPYAAVELLLDGTSDAAVRDRWRLLAEAGLPSQAAHPGATNAPHVTLASAPTIGDARLDAARSIAGMLPVVAPVAGYAVFGSRSFTLVLLLTPPAPLIDATHALARAVEDPRAGSWVPHVTLGRRMSAPQVGAALKTLSDPVPEIVLASVRRWDPQTGTTEQITHTTHEG